MFNFYRVWRFRKNIIMKKEIGDLKICIDEANMFYVIAKEQYDNDIEKLINRMYPIVVNVSFACELYFKAIMMYRSKNKDEFNRGHELEKLFFALDYDDREYIKEKFKEKFENKCFCQFIKDNNKAFENWRYAFQNAVDTNITELFGLVSILKEYVESIRSNIDDEK